MESTLYEGPFTLSHNATVWAIAYIPNSDIEPSEIAELVVDSYKTATPTGNFDYESGRLTLQCATEGAAISYALDAPENWIAYESPIEISGNCTVYAKAIANGYNESEMLIMEIGQFRCKPVDISYNGRYVTMKTDDPQAEIIYSVVLPDGVITVENEVYTGLIDVKTLCHVSAKAVREGYQDSEVSEYSVDCYGDENHAETNAGGLLKSSYAWCGSELLNGIEEFSVEGSLNDEDYSFLRAMAGLRHLDISKVADARIPDYAFKGSRLVSISLPAEITEYGDSILSEAQDLCSVIWNSDLMNVEARLLKGIANPNALIYVPAGVSVEDSSELNVVEGNDASSIILRDGFPFYVARAFTAADISYSRNFEMETL
ncbi:MAG: chitobiase/beta-hexosaminidase C-terminal domain-containing protein, partial [Muribaculaceae bacterium]|nr:chitobiase/beta-hexosaminidase C-terminal domain-containing protein [Muribaculaceae bacterium]